MRNDARGVLSLLLLVLLLLWLLLLLLLADDEDDAAFDRRIGDGCVPLAEVPAAAAGATGAAAGDAGNAFCKYVRSVNICARVHNTMMMMMGGEYQ